jgi:hypothetical protein
VSQVTTTGRTDVAVPGVRELARRGLLAERAMGVLPDERWRLVAEAYEIVAPVVFDRLTRWSEIRRGHRSCAAGIWHLASDCLDRYHDGVEAAADDLLRHARTPIVNLKGWIVGRLTAAAVDGYRRRRGARGALQRPRVPGWSLEAWTMLCEAVASDHYAETAVVARDVDCVLSEMRCRPAWYGCYAEWPQGRKQAPLLPPQLIDDVPPLALTRRHEADDRLLVVARLLWVLLLLRRSTGPLGCGGSGAVVAGRSGGLAVVSVAGRGRRSGLLVAGQGGCRGGRLLVGPRRPAAVGPGGRGVGVRGRLADCSRVGRRAAAGQGCRVTVRHARRNSPTGGRSGPSVRDDTGF